MEKTDKLQTLWKTKFKLKVLNDKVKCELWYYLPVDLRCFRAKLFNAQLMIDAGDQPVNSANPLMRTKSIKLCETSFWVYCLSIKWQIALKPQNASIQRSCYICSEQIPPRRNLSKRTSKANKRSPIRIKKSPDKAIRETFHDATSPPSHAQSYRFVPCIRRSP